MAIVQFGEENEVSLGSKSVFAAMFLAANLCTVEVFAINVPKGCVTIQHGAGSNLAQFQLANMTGKTAEDVTVTISGGAALPKITEANDPASDDDRVDDNNDGIHQSPTENDNVGSMPGTTIRLIYPSLTVPNGDTRTINLVFNDNTPPYTELTFCYSEESEGHRHFDICTGAHVDGGVAAAVAQPIGVHLMNIEVSNLSGAPVTELYLCPPANNPFVSGVVSSPHDASTFDLVGSNLRVSLSPALSSGGVANVNIEFLHRATATGETVRIHSAPFQCGDGGGGPGGIPTLSEWGLAAMGLILLGAATIVVRRQMA